MKLTLLNLMIKKDAHSLILSPSTDFESTWCNNVLLLHIETCQSVHLGRFWLIVSFLSTKDDYHRSLYERGSIKG